MKATSVTEQSATLVDLLRLRAARQGDEILFKFLVSGDVEGPVEEWSYAHLDFRARSLGALFQELDAGGERALLLYPPGLEFVAAFMGCMYAGVVAVPAYPPDPGRFERTLPRLRAIAGDCDARYVLTTTAIMQMAGALLPQTPELASLQWIASDSPEPARADAYVPHPIHAHDLAFLQYTSGSTGSPKGVMVSHDNILHNEHLIARCFGAGTGSVGVGWLPLFHDMGLIGNVLQPLYSGFPCVLMSPLAFLQRPLRWLQAVSRFRATISGGPNFAYDLCVRKVSAEDRASLDLGSWQVAFNGAEPVRAHTLARFADSFAACGFSARAFVPCYGLAEATLLVGSADHAAPAAVCQVSKKSLGRDHAVMVPEATPDAVSLVSSGRPQLDVVIVDPATGTPCEPGRVGEIRVRGRSVSGGYWNRPDDTVQTFGATHAGTGDPYLRTGDMGFVHDGELFVTGRRKDLVILRGQNHYPQDIERTVELAHPGIRAGCCAAFAVDSDSGEEQLVVVAEMEPARVAGDVMPVAEVVRSAIAEEHGVVAAAVVLIAPRSISKTSSGKIQRHSCRLAYLDGSLTELARSVADTPVSDEAQTPGTEPALHDALPEERQERVIALVRRHLADMLGIAPARIAPGDSFMSLGLDSLALVEAQERLESALSVRLPSAFLWQYPTITAAAEALLAHWQAQDRAESRLVRGPKRAAAAGNDLPPLSAGQFRMWFLSQLHPLSPAYHLVVGVRMTGQLDQDAVAGSLTELVARHEVLRTVYCEIDGNLRQVVREPYPVELVLHDARDRPEREDAMRRVGQELARAPFDLARGPLMRVALVALGDTEHVLFIVQHHIMTDGWSIGVMLRELAELYRARTRGAVASLPPPLQYADYARWQHELAAELDAQRAYWVGQLADLPQLNLFTDTPRPQELTLAGAGVSFYLPGPLTRSLEELARREGVTLFVTLMAIYAALLHRYTGQDDFGVGTVVAGREHPDTRSVLGLLVNTVVLRCDMAGAPTFVELLRRIRARVAEALAHADVPFDQVVEAVPRSGRDAGRNPLFQVSFVLESLDAGDMDVAGMRWSTVLSTPAASVEGTAKFDLELLMSRVDDGLWGVLEYSTALFHSATIERMAGHFCNLAARVVDHPEQPITRLALLSDDELRAVLAMSASGATLPDVQDQCIHERFAARARSMPDAPAVIAAGAVLSYDALERRANQVAHVLRSLGVRSEVRVGIFMERSPEMIVAILGILKAGGAYVPLDPAYPRDRLAYVVGDAGVRIVLTHGALGERLVEWDIAATCIDILGPDVQTQPEHAPRTAAIARDLAYVIYTSGSTGRPKGVMNEHGAVLHFAAALRQRVYREKGPGLRVAMNASLSFDASVQQWVQLLDGHTLVLVPEEERRDPESLTLFLREQRIDVIDTTPTQLRTWLSAGLAGFSGTVLVGGEALDKKLWDTARTRTNAVFYNVYGPTECTIDSTVMDLAASPVPSIGRPFGAIRVYILDRHMRPVPVGVPGEIHIGGPGLARGYLDRRALTAERFVPDPFGEPGGRLYTTGDLGRYLAGGDIEYLGRIDHQVKVRGFRIELDEIDAQLEKHPAVSKVVTVVRGAGTQQASLVAYLVVDETRRPPVSVLRRFAGAWLPEYMIPEKFMFIDHVPLTHSGKLDIGALPAPDGARPELEHEYVAPRTTIEIALVEILAEVLDLERVGVHDDFFALGGHSLAAAKVVSRVRNTFDVELSLRSFFEYPTVAGLATFITGEIGASISGEHKIAARGADRDTGEL